VTLCASAATARVTPTRVTARTSCRLPQVRAATDRATGRRIALKATRCESGARHAHNAATTLRNEARILSSLGGHPNIVSVVRLLEHRPARRGARCEVVLALELCAGATLRETLIAASDGGDGDGDGAEGSAALAISSESDRLLAHIFRQILTALAYCHARNFCHRDVKLENVVLRHPSAEWPRRGAVPVLLDFGIAAELRAGERLTGVMGSPGALWPPRAVHASVHRVLCASMRQWHF
jgi:serine/threonine protein kinase